MFLVSKLVEWSKDYLAYFFLCCIVYFYKARNQVQYQERYYLA